MNINFPVGLISNSNAKKNRKTLVNPESLHKILGGNDRCLLRNTKSLAELKDTVGEFREKKISVIFSNGGDGTHQQLINTLIHNYRDYSPYIIPLKSGTMNMLAKNLGLNLSPYKAVRWFNMKMQYHIKPTVTSKHILEISSEEDEKPKYGFVFIAGCGYKLLNLYYSYPEGGKRSAAKAIFSSMAAWLTKESKARSIYTYTPSKIRIDSREFEFPYLITLVSSLDNLVLGFSPFALKKLKDDRFYFMIDGEPMTKNYNFVKFFKPTDREEWKHKRLVSKAHIMKLHVDGGYSVDGEIIKLKHPKAMVEVKNGPKINFITPVLE
jgi:diacylglycerol kinase family enzyme